MDVQPQQRRRFSPRFDAYVAVALITIALGTVLTFLLVAGLPVTPINVPLAAVLLLVGGGFLFGVIYLPVSRFLGGTAFDDYVSYAMLEGRPWGIGHVVTFGMGLGALALLLAAGLAFGMILLLFWVVPTVVWLSVFHDVGVVDAATYAAMLSSGRPEYDGPLGMNTDPATLGFFVFCVAGWAIMLGALAVALSPMWLWWRVRERRARARWWAEYQREHGLS